MLSLFRRRKKDEGDASPQAPEHSTRDDRALEYGIPTLHDLLSPGGFDRSRTDLIRIGSYGAKALAVTGLPSEVSVGWLNPLLEYAGSMDLSVHIKPYEDRLALHYLTGTITRMKSKYRFVGHLQGQGDDLLRAIGDAEAVRDRVASNSARLFQMSVVATMYDTQEDRLKDAATIVEQRLAGRRIYSKLLEARQDEGYHATLPFGVNFVNDIRLNLDSYGAATILPFTDADLHHMGGYQFGMNVSTQSPIIYNPYDRSLTNHNVVCYAASGSGKSATIKTHIGRSIFSGERAAVLDPEGEYGLAADVLGGVVIKLGPGSPYKLNPFDVFAEENPDTGKVSVQIGPKVLDLMDLIGTMVQGLNPEEMAVVEMTLRHIYQDFGITTDPESLYERVSKEDPDRPGMFKYGRQRKQMPQLSDFVAKLRAQQETEPAAKRVADSMRPYCGEGVLSFFDCQTTVNIEKQWLTVFDLSLLDERLGKPVALQVALTWLWESFVKRDPKQKKRVIVDEAWLLADYEPAMRFLENCVRRARKRTAGLTIISQDFRKFALHPRGPAIHSNSNTMIFLRCEDVDLDDIQQTFKLSDGERNFIATCGKGSGILRVKGKPVAFQVIHTASEKQWVYTTALKESV